MAKSTCELIPGRMYHFRHKRKGEFVALFIGTEPTKPGDPDPYFVRVEIDTGGGSPYAWLANAVQYIDGIKTTPPRTQKLLRPGLILAVREEPHG